MTIVTPPSSIRIFVASPSDVQVERDHLSKVVIELNRTVPTLLRMETHVELVRWETHTFPQAGPPQQVINNQIGDYDIFVGILWKRFGSPTGSADSGTQEEFNRAYTSWQNKGRPQILFYFSQALYRITTIEELEQLRKVLEFRKAIREQALVWDYREASQFSSTIRNHLIKAIDKLLSAADERSSENLNQGATSARTESRLAIGSAILITDIGPDDSFFDQQDKFIGRRGVLIEVREKGEWSDGIVRFETRSTSDDDCSYTFVQFRYRLIETI